MQSSLSEFVRQYPVKSFRRNETIIFQDDQPTTMYFIKSGFVKGYDINSQGTEHLLWLASEGDFFPIVWAFQITPTVQYFISAFSDVEVYAVRHADFKNFIDNNPQALLEVSRKMAENLHDAFQHLNVIEKTKAEERIVHSLYYLSVRFGDIAKKKAREITVPITHQDIASLVGLSRETVAVELKKLKDKGYIHYDKYQFVVHPEKLEAML